MEIAQYLDTVLEGIDEIIRPAGIGPGHACHLYVARLNTDKVFVRSLSLPGSAQEPVQGWLWEPLPSRVELGLP